jgi:hypothetical protein
VRYIVDSVDVVFVPCHEAFELFIVHRNPSSQLAVSLEKVNIRSIRHRIFNILETLVHGPSEIPPKPISTFPTRLVFAASVKHLKVYFETLGLFIMIISFSVAIV